MIFYMFIFKNIFICIAFNIQFLCLVFLFFFLQYILRFYCFFLPYVSPTSISFLPLLAVTIDHLTVDLCRDCKIIRDPATMKSKGYGFVSFVNKQVCLCFWAAGWPGAMVWFCSISLMIFLSLLALSLCLFHILSYCVRLIKWTALTWLLWLRGLFIRSINLLLLVLY